jgi:hypothetical protein
MDFIRTSRIGIIKENISTKMELDKITAEDFIPMLNQQVNLRFTAEVNVVAELIEVTELEGYSPLERKPFSVVFKTEPKHEYYNQGIFDLIHPSFGEISIFLTPLGFDSNGMKYEAVFS